jgi:hypothetical protein
VKSAAANLEAEIELRRTALERHAASVEGQIEALRQQLLAVRAEFAEFVRRRNAVKLTSWTVSCTPEVSGGKADEQLGCRCPYAAGPLRVR